MGDRCSMTVTCRRTDAHLFEAVGFAINYAVVLDEHGELTCHGPDDGKSPIVELFDEEANYAYGVGCGWPDCELPKDVLFFGSHEAGCDYGEGFFACDGGEKLAWVARVHGSQEPAVDVDRKTCKPRAGQLALVRDYFNQLANVEAIFGGELTRSATCSRSIEP